jgi:hypothetical protein
MNSTPLISTVTILLYLTVLLASAIGVRSAHTLASAAPAVAHAGGCLPTRDGYLRARMRGASDLDIDWQDADMQCDGGLRPEERGVRVTFLGRLPQDGQQIRLVFGIATAADAATARNVPANVTVIFEGEQKLYSSAGEGKCTIDELSLQPKAEAGNAWRRVVARGFCTVPVTTLAGNDALELDRFDFAGGLRDED